MKKLMFAGLLLLLPILAMAQSQFEGTWKNDESKMQLPTKPDMFVLQNGTYECKTCVPPYFIKADGTDQKVSGDPYADTLSVKVIDDHTVENTYKRAGKVVETDKNVISADGNTLTVYWTDSGQPTGGTRTGTYTAKRGANGPAGAHLLSGSWKGEKQEVPAGITWTYKIKGNELTMTTPYGQSYTAKLDGIDAPYKGDPGTTNVSVKMLSKNTLEETDKRDGKVTGIIKFTVSADGKTGKWVWEDKLHGTTMQGIAVKQ